MSGILAIHLFLCNQKNAMRKFPGSQYWDAIQIYFLC